MNIKLETGQVFLEPKTSDITKDFSEMLDSEKRLFVQTARNLKDLSLIALKMGEIKRFEDQTAETGKDRVAFIEKANNAKTIEELDSYLKDDFLKNITGRYGFQTKFIELVMAKSIEIEEKTPKVHLVIDNTAI